MHDERDGKEAYAKPCLIECGEPEKGEGREDRDTGLADWLAEQLLWSARNRYRTLLWYDDE